MPKKGSTTRMPSNPRMVLDNQTVMDLLNEPPSSTVRSRYCVAIVPRGTGRVLDNPADIRGLIRRMLDRNQCRKLHAVPTNFMYFSYFEGPTVEIEDEADPCPTLCLFLKADSCLSCLRWRQFLGAFGMHYVIPKSNNCNWDQADDYYADLFSSTHSNMGIAALKGELSRNRDDIMNLEIILPTGSRGDPSRGRQRSGSGDNDAGQTVQLAPLRLGDDVPIPAPVVNVQPPPPPHASGQYPPPPTHASGQCSPPQPQSQPYGDQGFDSGSNVQQQQRGASSSWQTPFPPRSTHAPEQQGEGGYGRDYAAESWQGSQGSRVCLPPIHTMPADSVSGFNSGNQIKMHAGGLPLWHQYLISDFSNEQRQQLWFELGGILRTRSASFPNGGDFLESLLQLNTISYVTMAVQLWRAVAENLHSITGTVFPVDPAQCTREFMQRVYCPVFSDELRNLLADLAGTCDEAFTFDFPLLDSTSILFVCCIELAHHTIVRPGGGLQDIAWITAKDLRLLCDWINKLCDVGDKIQILQHGYLGEADDGISTNFNFGALDSQESQDIGGLGVLLSKAVSTFAFPEAFTPLLGTAGYHKDAVVQRFGVKVTELSRTSNFRVNLLGSSAGRSYYGMKCLGDAGRLSLAFRSHPDVLRHLSPAGYSEDVPAFIEEVSRLFPLFP